MTTTGHAMYKQKAATAEFDLFRVDIIRAKLDADDYTVDSLQIADKIIDLELALSGAS
jgi:anti-sigma28 factor (negative regulator of flagellin synthesis)